MIQHSTEWMVLGMLLVSPACFHLQQRSSSTQGTVKNTDDGGNMFMREMFPPLFFYGCEEAGYDARQDTNSKDVLLSKQRPSISENAPIKHLKISTLRMYRQFKRARHIE